MSDPAEFCARCRFWERRTNAREEPMHCGYCRRYPPGVAPPPGGEYHEWTPITTDATDWCGEFRGA
jgi:hypothetical protein